MRRGNKRRTSREIAFDILWRVYRTRSQAAALLASYRWGGVSPKERRLAYELVLGVLRWQRQLDYFIEKYARRAVESLDLRVVIALRLGLYQVRFLERVPDHAAVDTSVELVRTSGAARAARLVNAVLRRATRSREDRPGADIRDELERLSVELSHPRWLVEKWIADFGRSEAEDLMRANNVSPPVVLRINALKASEKEVLAALEREGVEVEPCALAPGAYRVKAGTLAMTSPVVGRGQIYLQDEGSQLVAHLVSPQPGMRVLDVCAAPGSKTMHLAALMNNCGMIVAGDIRLQRLRALCRVKERLGAEIVSAVALDGTVRLPFLSTTRFDRVLLDAPCSGTGTLRRNPEIKWRLQQGHLARLSQKQRALLQEAARWVAPEGLLIYSTCSLEREENEDVIGPFLTDHADFQLVPAGITGGERGWVRLFPHRQATDGFFVAVMKKV
jgi:16S rRNA (cytosine967-C5)-methyltransferase